MFSCLTLCFYVLFLYRSVLLVLTRMLLVLIAPFVIIAHIMSFLVVQCIFLFEVSLHKDYSTCFVCYKSQNICLMLLINISASRISLFLSSKQPFLPLSVLCLIKSNCVIIIYLFILLDYNLNWLSIISYQVRPNLKKIKL